MNSNHKDSPGAGTALISLAFGVLCFCGAYVSFANGKWPAFMPPQLDAVAFLFSLLSETLGAYVGGVVALLIGLLSIAFGIWIFCKLPSQSKGSE